MGRRQAQQIGDLSLQLAGVDPPGEGYLEKVGRLNMARLQAEEIVLKERVLLEPEPGADPDSSEPDEQDRSVSQEMPLVVDGNHPLWEQVNAEQKELAHGQ